MAIFNLNGDEWNEETEHEGFAFSPAGDFGLDGVPRR
jgi:hypothetical protein